MKKMILRLVLSGLVMIAILMMPASVLAVTDRVVSNGTDETVSALGCDAYIQIDDPCCNGYCVYVDGAYKLTEGGSGNPDGFCAFYVCAGTHTIKITKNGRSASITKFFQSGSTYSWVSMPYCWCCSCPESTSDHCQVYIEVRDPCCKGYCVYVDGTYILTEGASGTPDGYCAFYVSAGTHKFELRKGGYSTSKSWYCHSGTAYRWVSMPYGWCGNGNCQVYVQVDDNTCVGYDVYVDGVYKLTEGASGNPDGYCAFYVSAGTHKFELRKGDYTTSKSWYCHCGTDYSWVSMPDYWCGDAYEHPPYECGTGDSEGRQQLVEAIEELEQTIINSIDLDIRQVADSYALLATAAKLTPWWRELARLALDTISAVVGTAINVGEFLTPEGGNQVLEDVSTSQQIFKELKDSKNILGGIAAIQGLAGLYRNADSYKLSFEAINTVEEVARQEYEERGDNYRTSNAAWLELWLPSTPNGLLIPLKTGTPTKEGSRSSVTSWVNGIKEVREEVKNSFDNVINKIPDPLPADYPLDETITYINNLKQQIRGSGYRVVKFKCVEDDKERKRHITLGMVWDGNEVTNELYDAWMHDLDVQYTSTVYKTSKTIVQVTTYGVPATGVTKKVMKGVSDLYEVVDIIHIPSDLGNLIDKPVHPLDALQHHIVKMNNDLVHETSNLWALSDGTLKYLQYTWESETTSDPIVIAPGLGEKAANPAEEVVGAPYLSGGKGFDYDTMKFVDSATIKRGYRYWNDVKGQLDWGEGLDCSGLSFWAFNKAAGATKHQDPANPIYYEGASGQWADTERFKQISTTIPSVSDLNTEYLLFLDTPPIKGAPDHVGMYVGNGYVIHSRGSVGVEKKTLNGWLDIPYGNKKYKDYFFGYGRVKVVSGDTFNIGDIVRVTMNLNVLPSQEVPSKLQIPIIRVMHQQELLV
ncbi:MAG: NlpC/P60 family protein [Euryarchaeota archaeon]|nr:NlpC/P60 family protein [Euryarchaeota archaeon]